MIQPPEATEALSLGILSERGTGYWMPIDASTIAGNVDFVFNFILVISIIFFALIVFAMAYFLIRYNRDRAKEPGESPNQNMLLEITWSVIPLILVLAIFYVGFKEYMNLAISPPGAYEIQVLGQQWQWAFTYPNGYMDTELHVPIGRPIELVMTSQDVIHSFFVPAFRVKKDLVPGRYTKTWFEATKLGEFDLFCAEYCGTGHSDMLSTVIVHTEDDFKTWLKEASDFFDRMSLVDAGEKLYKLKGCASCHTNDGKGSVGPSFKNLYGKYEVLKGGERITVDENYIRKSLLDPAAEIVAGFEPVMPTYQGRIEDREILAIIQYMKSLSEEYKDTVIETWEEEESVDEGEDNEGVERSEEGESLGEESEFGGESPDNGDSDGEEEDGD